MNEWELGVRSRHCLLGDVLEVYDIGLTLKIRLITKGSPYSDSEFHLAAKTPFLSQPISQI